MRDLLRCAPCISRILTFQKKGVICGVACGSRTRSRTAVQAECRDRVYSGYAEAQPALAAEQQQSTLPSSSPLAALHLTHSNAPTSKGTVLES